MPNTIGRQHRPGNRRHRLGELPLVHRLGRKHLGELRLGSHNNPCCEPAIRWAGWNPAYGTGSGYDATGQFAVSGWIPLVGWVTGYYDNVRACIWVDGYGNWGRC